MVKQSRSTLVMQAVLDEVAERLMAADELAIRIPEICEATGVNYGSVYHHFGSREGVIDAAYNMIFTTYAEEDLALFRQVNETVGSLEEYVALIGPILVTIASGPGRKERRAMRARIVAAATTRPELKVLIGATQARLSEELRRLTLYAQQRGWLRNDIPASSIAVVVQILVFGRALDDISDHPIDESEWERSIIVLFAELLER